MTDDAAAFLAKQQAERSRIAASLAARRAGPRRIPVPVVEQWRDRGCRRGGW